MYKDYNLTQHTLPMETSVQYPTNDMSRYVNKSVETTLENIFDEFKHHRSATSYHPIMMLKIDLYVYTQFICSGRKIEKLLNNHIRMMWLLQKQTPSYKNNNEKGNFYIISIEIAFITCPRTLCSRLILFWFNIFISQVLI